MKFIVYICLLFCVSTIHAQNIIGFHRGVHSFFVYDNGSFHQLEHRPVTSFKEGDFFVAYINDKNEFKLYRNGRSHYLDEGVFINEYRTSRYLLTYKKENQLNVWDNNRVRILSTWAGNYTVSDSLVVFHDDVLKYFRVYYNNRIFDLEPYQNMFQVTTSATGKNILAYIDRNNYFYIFYRGEKILIDKSFNINKFSAGRDIVAFETDDAMQFKFYYKGNIIDVDALKPINFKTGDELVAYTGAEGGFKIFEKGVLHTISSFAPDFYDVKDNIVIYSDSLNHFSVFFNGLVHKLEETKPVGYITDAGNVAYMHLDGRLKIFSEGKLHIVTFDRISSYRLSGNVLHYDTGSLSGNIWHRGTIY